MGRIEPHELDGTLQQLTEPAAIAEAAQLQEQVGNNFSSQDHSTCRMVGNTVIGHPWTTGLFDCHEHQTNACLLGSFIYLLMMPALCSQWIMGSKYRTKLRRRYDLVEAPYEDVISHVFCLLCSLCQEFRELKNRGLDPALGHELEALTLDGIQVKHVEKGFIRCNFVIPKHLSDRDGNWQVGAIAILVDDVGAAAIFSTHDHIKASVAFDISYYSTVKIQEEVEIEAKVVGNKGKLSSVLVKIKKKESGEMVAMGKQWMASITVPELSKL
ncbi:hypothetical protein F0562_024686 [Nyssa sinensis]|uniref:Acyl-coenzyme A thioesterase 13 n=1 Tax=Nyssa sinensis TaxID=561372 RepID=A0A5J5BB37_9ASTE|nr:hypothetical protein F0562_024686 [Nyssa sinensis]